MCGRFAFFSPDEAVREYFSLKELPPIEPRFNIAPTQFVPVVRSDGEVNTISMLYWGLVPFWAREKAIGQRMINARGETLAEKPSFRNAFKKRRCIVPASGFYEWKREADIKRPYFVSRKDEKPIAFAGLWERWDKGDEPLESFTIVTTAPNNFMQKLHNRMPVILSGEQHKQWLDPGNEDTAALSNLIAACDDGLLTARPVSRKVNNPRNEGAELIEQKL